MNIYLPMTVPQALTLIRLRLDALFGNDGVRGYHSPDDAVAAFRASGSRDEIALVTVSYDGLAHEKLAREGKVNGAQVCPHTGIRLWVMNGDARSDLSRSARFSMEIIPGEGRRADTASSLEWGGGPLGNGGC